MNQQHLDIWHLTSEDGWIEGTNASNIPEGALVTLKTEWEITGQMEKVHFTTSKDYHVVNNDILRDAYTRFFGALPFYTLE